MPTTTPLTQVIAKALREPELRSQLMAEPRKTLQTMNVDLPAEQQVTVLESTAQQSFFVLPILTEADVQQLQNSLDTVHPLRSVRSRVLIKAFHDPDYKLQLLKNPKAVLRAEGLPVPESTAMTALENSLEQLYIVLPHVHHSHHH